MVIMEGKELYSCSLSSIVINPFAVQWSQDNHLSIITEKGIHIFELVPSPMSYGSSVKFSRSFVYPSDVLPTEVFSQKVNSILWKLKKEEIYSFLLEEILLPRVNVISDLVPKVVFVAWSHQGMLHPSKCLLGMISSAGAVDVLLKDGIEWFSACDLQCHWLRIVVEGFPSNLTAMTSEQIKSHIRRLQAVAISWSNLKTNMDHSFSYFIVAYRSTDILIWRIPAVMDHSRQVIPTVALRTNLNINIRIDILKWISITGTKNLIVMGLSNGKIQGLLFEESQGKVFWNIIEIYTEEDLIKVTSIKFCFCSEKEIRLFISKSTFLIVIRVDSEGNKLEDYCYQVPAFSITGLTVISKDQILINTQDGRLSILTIENKKITSEEIKTDLPKTYSQYLGLADSWNKILFATVTSPNAMYDHLVVREPSTLYIFSIESHHFDPFEVLQKNETSSLLNHWDCITAIGMKLSKSLISLESINKIPNNFESLSVYNLRIIMWLSVLANVFQKKKSQVDFSEVSDELIEIRSLISLYSASAYLIAIATKSDISAEQRLAARFLRTYLEVYVAGEMDEEETTACRNAQRALKFSCKIETFGPEVCTLCKKAIVDLPWKMKKCPSGHKLPRCAVTLLQITSEKYRSCPICKQIFHLCLDEEYPEGPRCLFCDVPVLYDFRVFGSVDSGRKNFSQRKVSKLRSSDLEDGIDDDDEKGNGRKSGSFRNEEAW